jgi:hypothetical protein
MNKLTCPPFIWLPVRKLQIIALIGFPWLRLGQASLQNSEKANFLQGAQ